jgi:hypothetical protein
VEIKNVNEGYHDLALKGIVPEVYYAQCQHQLLAWPTLEVVYYFSYDRRKRDGAIVEVRRDEKFLKSLLKQEQEFWNHVLEKSPPKLLDSDFIPMNASQRWEQLAKELLPIREELASLKSLQEREDEILSEMKLLSEGRSAKGHGVLLQKHECRGFVDYSKIPQLKDVDLEIYRKPSFQKWTVKCIGKM